VAMSMSSTTDMCVHICGTPATAAQPRHRYRAPRARWLARPPLKASTTPRAAPAQATASIVHATQPSSTSRQTGV
jgi:hypothetical protein